MVLMYVIRNSQINEKIEKTPHCECILATFTMQQGEVHRNLTETRCDVL